MTSKDEMLNQGDDVVERLKDAANRMLNGDIIGHNLSVFATDILTIINRATSPPVPDDVAEAVNRLRCWLTNTVHYEDIETLIRAASTPSASVQQTGANAGHPNKGVGYVAAEVQSLTNLRNKLTTEITELVLENERLLKLAYYDDLNEDGSVRETFTYKALLIGCRAERDELQKEVRALRKIPLSASTSGEFIAPDYIKGWNAAIEAITSKVINNLGE